MHIAALQNDIIWEDKAANHAEIDRMVAAADLPPETFLLLPELGDTGFSFNLDVIVDDRTLPWARDLARRHRLWLQVGYATHGDDQRGRNNASLIAPDGAILGTYQKLHPFSFGREIEYFSGGDHLLLRRCGDLTVAPTICYDLRFPELFRIAARAGAELFALGASWPDARQSHWRALLIARAIENQAYVVAANRVGRDPHLQYAGGSIIVSPMGEVLAEADAEPAVIQAEIDASALRDWRKSFPALTDIRPELLGGLPIDSAD